MGRRATTVANINPNIIQSLLDEVDKLETRINAFTESRRSELRQTRINEVRAAITGGATKVDTTRWSQLSEQKQNELQEELVMVQDALLKVAQTESRKEPSALLDNESASIKSIIWLAIFGFIVAATLLSLVR